MNGRHRIIPAVWVIVTDSSDRMFLLRRANTGWKDGSWTVPAGHVEQNEGPTAAAIRELKEEAGIDATADELRDPLVYFYPEDAKINERVSIFFLYFDKESRAFNAEPAMADAGDWFTLDTLPGDMPPLLRRALKDHADGVRYSERHYDDSYHQELLQ
jgi:8-oxo-dGTP pyrophosphatase MutT (NUDIX family)